MNYVKTRSMKMRSFCGDGAREMVEEEEKVNHGDSSYAYWLCNNSFDLNEPQREDKEQGSHENTNGAFSSSSSSRRIDFDLNELPPSDSEREEPQQSPDRCSLTLLGNHDINENPPNPNSQTSPSSGKRRSTSGGFKKVKKPRPHEPPEAVSEVVSPPKWLDQVMKFKEEIKAPHRISKAPLTCEDARLIFAKELSVSDVNPKQSRYLMPFNQLKRNDFLTQGESSFIEQEEDEEGDKPGIGVILVNQKAEK